MTLSELWKNARAVLFDFDGVLADSEPFYRKSWNEVLANYNHSVPENEYWKHWAFFGRGLRGEIDRTGLRIDEDDINSLVRMQKDLYRDYCVKGMVPLFRNAPAVLALTVEKKTCAIASNTHSELVKAIAKSQIDPLPPVIGGEGLRRKPSPDIFLRASDYLSVDPSQCLVFEDAWKGVKAAESAGMPVVLIRNSYNAGLPTPEASCEIQGLHELYGFLKGLK